MKKLIESRIAEGNGVCRFYESEGWDMRDIMDVCTFLDDSYTYGLIEYEKGPFVEIIKLEEGI